MHGYLRESTERLLQMALKEKVLVEEKNPQDYQKKEEKVKNWKEKTWRVCSADFRWQERSFGDVSGIVL